MLGIKLMLRKDGFLFFILLVQMQKNLMSILNIACSVFSPLEVLEMDLGSCTGII